MTNGERDRIDALRHDLAIAQGETIEAITAAVHAHRSDCSEQRLTPMKESLDWLVSNAQARRAEAAYRRRLYLKLSAAAGIIATATIVASPYVLHFF